MKKVWFLGLLAAAILAGCSDNDDNGGDEVKPGGGQVESPYLPQRIAQVKVFKDGEISDSVCCYYDTRGRVNLVEFYELEYYGWDASDDESFYYFEDYSIESDGGHLTNYKIYLPVIQLIKSDYIIMDNAKVTNIKTI